MQTLFSFYSNDLWRWICIDVFAEYPGPSVYRGILIYNGLELKKNGYDSLWLMLDTYVISATDSGTGRNRFGK